MKKLTRCATYCLVCVLFFIANSASAVSLCVVPPPENKACAKKEWLKINGMAVSFQRCVVTKHPEGYTSVAWRFDAGKNLYLGVVVYGASINWQEYKNTLGGKYLMELITARVPKICGNSVAYGTLEGTWRKFPPAQ